MRMYESLEHHLMCRSFLGMMYFFQLRGVASNFQMLGEHGFHRHRTGELDLP